jgi:DNA-binding XRE family transcriptional regulator
MSVSKLENGSVQIKLTPRLTKAARSLLGWSQDDLARESGMSKSTIGAFEAKPEMAAMQTMNNRALVETFQKGGIAFIPENGGGHGVRLEKPVSKGERA